MKSVANMEECIVDQCAYGLVTWDNEGGSGPAKKATKFLTNAPCMAKYLSDRCPGNHEHVPLLQGRASAAAVYPSGLVKALCKGVILTMCVSLIWGRWARAIRNRRE